MNQQPLPNLLQYGALQDLLGGVERGEVVPPLLIPELARQMQPLLIPGAEDVESLGFIMILIETTTSYMGFYVVNVPGIVVYPEFYKVSVYYIFKLAQKRGQNPVYLESLAGVMKRRLMDSFPQVAARFPDLPSLRQVIMSKRFFEGGEQEVFAFQTKHAYIKFEFANLYKKYDGGHGRENFQTVACFHVSRILLPNQQESFRQFAMGFHNFLTNPHYSVSFA